MSIFGNILALFLYLVYSNNRGSVIRMIYPSIDKLLTIVDSKYTLVYVAANRSKQMIKNDYFQKPVSKYKSSKTIGRAMEEIYDNLIHVDKR